MSKCISLHNRRRSGQGCFLSAAGPRLLLIAGLLCLFAPATALRAADDALPPEASELSRLYRERVGEITTRYRETVQGLPRQFEQDLVALLARFQKSGDLDGVLATAKEQKRFSEAMRQEDRDPFELTPEMPAAAVVAQPAELRILQEQYLQKFKDAATVRQKDIGEVTSKYLARLDAIQRDLTRANRIRDAVAVKREADRLNKGVTDDNLLQLLEGLALAPAPTSAVVVAASPGSTNETVPTFGSVPNWARWTNEKTRHFARERMLFDHPDLPDELNVDYYPKAGRGRFFGRCSFDMQQVGPYLCGWFGKAIVWRVSDVATLNATFELESRQLSAGEDCGPHAQLVLYVDRTPLKMLNAPLLARATTLRVAKDPASNRCALIWVQGKTKETFELPASGEVRLLLTVTVRNPGEECDTNFSIQ